LVGEWTRPLPAETVMERLQAAGVPAGVVQHAQDLLERDIDIIGVGTPMQMHVPVSVAALEAGKHVLSEVTAAVTMDECWQLLEAVKKSGKKYMMAENCCYSKHNMLIEEMVSKGMFGDVYFAEGAYVHNCSRHFVDKKGEPTWRVKWQVGRLGSTYGTHALGPCARWIGERVTEVSCFGSGVHTNPQYKSDDAVIVLCRTESGKLIKTCLDIQSHRPYAMGFSLQGTKGAYQFAGSEGDEHRIYLDEDGDEKDGWRSLWDYSEHLPQCWTGADALRAQEAGHGGSDYIEVLGYVNCILNDTRPPIDIYDALNWTAVDLCSMESIQNGGKVVAVPDFGEKKEAKLA
ncbi:MAG: Gfo/Idh/MocA family oxidoreductase, partial [Phycisphaerae bacterium]|nr:Gfo/Idh/MocA family oxidoreductase [Phycisphaerae bacterium]